MMQLILNWLSMGGYSVYIWPAYGLVFFVLGCNYYVAKRQQAMVQKTLRRWFNSE